jgi:hypothetical protein
LRTQRNSDPVSRLVNAIANALFHKGGVKERDWGEGTDDDLSLSDSAQTGLAVWWLVVVPIMVIRSMA